MPKRSIHRGPNVGLSTGLKKYEFISSLFLHQKKAKLSDPMLAVKIRTEFPDCTTNWSRRIGYLRNLWNRGALRFQTMKPGRPLERYDDDGKIFPRRRGPDPK